MGLPDILQQTVSVVFHGTIFLVKLVLGSTDARATLHHYTRRVTPEELENDKLSRERAKRIRPRRLVMSDGGHRQAEQGERGGMLYDTWETPLFEMHEFGLGVATFFLVVAGYACVLFLQALTMLPSVCK